MNKSLKTPLIALVSIALIGATYFVLYQMYLSPRPYMAANNAPTQTSATSHHVKEIDEEQNAPEVIDQTKEAQAETKETVYVIPPITDAAPVETIMPITRAAIEEQESVDAPEDPVHSGSVSIQETVDPAPPTDAPVIENTKPMEHPVSGEMEHAHKDTDETPEFGDVKYIDGKKYIFNINGEWQKPTGGESQIADFELTGNLIGD